MILLDIAVRAVTIGVLVVAVLGFVAWWLTEPLPPGYDEPPSRLDELDAAMTRHPASGTDPVRLAQMAAIAEAEEAWDRDVWGDR